MQKTDTDNEFTLEDIMREFGGNPDLISESPEESLDAPTADADTPPEDAPAESQAEEAPNAEESPAPAESAEEIPAETPVENPPEPTQDIPQASDSETPADDEPPAEGEAPTNDEAPAEAEGEESAQPEADAQSQAMAETLSRDTIRLDNLAEVIAQATEANRELADIQKAERMESLENAPAEDAEAGQADPDAQVSADDTVVLENLSQMEPLQVPSDAPVERELPPEELPRGPIQFRPHSRLRELKKQLVSGPEKRYYDLTEVGLGRLQAAIFVSVLIVLLCAGATALYAMGMVMASRLRLMIFSQVLAMLVSATLGCYVLMDGIGDLFHGRFTLNTMLVFTFAACCADAVYCLQELRVPCCAAFSLEMTLALYNRYLRRHTEMSQMDTLRKAVRLDSIVKTPDFHEGKPGILRGEGQVADFMDVYDAPTGPEKAQSVFAFLSLLVCIGIAVLAGVMHGLSMGVQIFATSLLVAIPASFFVALSRPADIVQRRLHMVGTVLCGWRGVKSLCGSAVFPLRDQDVFPLGSAKLNGVKFFGDRDPEDAIAYATALIRENGGGLEPVFQQLLDSRNGRACQVENFQSYAAGGVGGEVDGEPVLLGTLNFLQDMGVDIPDGTMVAQALYCSIDGQLSAVFAISYNRMKSAAAGLVTLTGYRKIQPMVICDDFMMTEPFLRGKFGVRTKRFLFPDRDTRKALSQRQPDPEQPVLALTTQEGLASAAYAVTASRSLRTACKAGIAIHFVGGILGMLIMLALAYLGSTELLTPVNVLLYQLVWMLPGLLVTEWTRTI